MDLQIKDKLFIITGASDGLGFATARSLLDEGALVIAVARTRKRLDELETAFKGKIEVLLADVFAEGFSERLMLLIGSRSVDGIFINAGGPPAGTFEQLAISDWDHAYQTILRWKAELLLKMLPLFRRQHYGRILISESISVKQPIPNLILSNSLRAAVVGMAKTLSSETAADNITVNVIAPGYHDTHAMQRLFQNKMKNQGVSMEEARADFEKNIPIGRMGKPEEFGKLAAWLMSPLSGYLTGQTFSVDGGVAKNLFG